MSDGNGQELNWALLNTFLFVCTVRCPGCGRAATRDQDHGRECRFLKVVVELREQEQRRLREVGEKYRTAMKESK